MDIKENISLQPFNTFQVDVNAAYFTTLKTHEDLQILLTSQPWASTEKLIIGSGSNILFTKDYPGLIIKNELMGIEVLDENDDHIWMKVAAGENWHAFVMYLRATKLWWH